SSSAESIVIAGLTPSTAEAVHTITVNGVAFVGASADLADAAALVSNLGAAVADDGTVLSSLYTITSTNTAADMTLVSKTDGNKAAADFTITTTSAGGFSAGSSVTITPGAGDAEDAITAIDAALATVASERATLGATQAQLESTVRNLANVAENTSAAAGRIMDTDYAAETANLTKAQILQQAATSVLAQANAQPQSVLALLR
ncbi:flagellin, partial [Luminiphilus sp.]|nr:flagellin [Luminiphilus sp.]